MNFVFYFYFIQVLESVNTKYYKISYDKVLWYMSFPEDGYRFDFITVEYKLILNTPDAHNYFILKSSLNATNCRPNYTQTYQLTYSKDYTFELLATDLCPLSTYNFTFTVSRSEFNPVTRYSSLTTGWTSYYTTISRNLKGNV